MATTKTETTLETGTETVKSAKVLAAYYMSKNIPCYVEGPPGIGKSEMWAQIAQEHKIGFIDLRLAQLDPVDLRGLPTVTQDLKSNTSFTSWARPDMWPVVERDGPKGILLLDELGDCGKAMQSAAYQVILDKRAGPHVIPKGWYVCGAGNSQKHRAGAQGMSSALANRFAWILLEADITCFLEYAAIKGWHHYVSGFLKFRTKMLHDMNAGSLKAFPTPRSWYKVHRVADAPKDIRFQLVRGCVGEGAAVEFEGYLKILDLPDIEDIVKDPKKCHIPKEPSSKYALSSMLARYANGDNFEAIMKYASRSDFGRDFEICTVLDATKRDRDLTETDAFIAFANRNKDLQL